MLGTVILKVRTHAVYFLSNIINPLLMKRISITQRKALAKFHATSLLSFQTRTNMCTLQSIVQLRLSFYPARSGDQRPSTP